MTKTKTHEISIVEQASVEVSIPVQRGLGSAALVTEKDQRRAEFQKSNRTQDRHTAPSEKGLQKTDKDFENEHTRRIERERVRDMQDQILDSLSPAELQAMADEILGEPALDEIEAFYLQDEPQEYIDEEQEQHYDSVVIAGGEEIRERLAAVKVKKRDAYDPNKDDDTEDYVLDGMHIVSGRKGQ